VVFAILVIFVYQIALETRGVGIFGFSGSGVKSSPGVDEAIGFEPVLFVIQLAIAAVHRQQLGVRAALDDFARLEHQNLIGAADGGQAMRDDKRRAPGPQPPQTILNHLFALAVQARGRLVENQDARVRENRAAQSRHAGADHRTA
jgi:hypothetical protein